MMPILPHRHKQWPAVLDRARALNGKCPSEGLSLAAFERQALFDVDPTAITAFVKALRRREAIWTRGQGGNVRVFAQRPESISGIFPSATLLDRFLTSVTPCMSKIAADLSAREAAKDRRDTLAAQEARDRLDASGRRLVALAVRHTTSDLHLEDCRRAMWRVFNEDTMRFAAGFEPRFAMDSGSTVIEIETSVRRIASNLDLADKVLALIRKAGDRGLTKSAICRGIRPRIEAARIGAALTNLKDEQRVAERRVRIEGSGRAGVRYFGVDEET